MQNLNQFTVQDLLSTGSGRTTRLLRALPRKSHYFVQSAGICQEVDRFLRTIDREDIKVNSIKDAGSLRQVFPENVGIDHFILENDLLSDCRVELISDLMMVKNIYLLDEMGFPIAVSPKNWRIQRILARYPNDESN